MHPLRRFGNKLATRKNSLCDDFRRRARRGSPNVRDKIANGEIDLMPHRRDDRQTRFKDSARDDFLIEGPEIFQAAAAARDEDQVQIRPRSSRRPEALLGTPALDSIELIQQPNARGNFRSRPVALDTARRHHDLQARIAALHDVQHVANRGARGRSHEPDALRISAAEFILEGLYAHRRISRSEERGFAAEEKKREGIGKDEEGKRPGYRRPQFN